MASKKSLRKEKGPTPKKLGPSSKYVYLRVSDLRIDPDAQRKVRPAWVKEIAENLDPDKFGTPVVSRRILDGLYYIDDGQHRILAVRLLGWNDILILCELFDNSSQVKSARTFLARNHRKNVITFDDFRIRVTAQDENACAINGIVLNAGLSVSNNKQQGSISAVKALEYVYKGAGISPKDGPVALEKTLGAINLAWGVESSNFNGFAVQAIGAFIIKYSSKVNIDRLITTLSKLSGGVSRLVEFGRQNREIRGGTMTDATARVLLVRYNRGARAGKLISWDK